MNRLLAIFLFFIFCLNSYSKSNEVRIMESLSMYSSILGQEVKYSICLPADYFLGNQKYPVTYLLHGLGDDETSWLEYGRINQVADQMVKEGEVVPMIFVIPQGFRTYYMNDYAGKFNYQDMFIKELIPFIDSTYRTIPDKIHRATMGYSMGGFGALILPLKNPEVISTCVPLSISIRTDKQYMEEDSSGWNNQWGSIFGGVGKIGKDRLTDYYKQNNPFHSYLQNNLSKLKELKIFIDNGDDEQTLCRSNEELHILMREKGIPHEFRVRDGGHSFNYWYSAIPNALRFMSDAFELKPYRGDIVLKDSMMPLPEKQMQSLRIDNQEAFVFVPAEYEFTNRLYPVVYIAGNFSTVQQNSFAAMVNAEIESTKVAPMLLVFLPENSVTKIKTMLPEFESKLRIRKGYRFRAIIGFQNDALNTCAEALIPEQFSSCILADAYFSKTDFSELIAGKQSEIFKRTSFFIVAPDSGIYYEGNGSAHMFLRDNELKHEYRVTEGKGGFEWLMNELPEIINFTGTKFHK